MWPTKKIVGQIFIVDLNNATTYVSSYKGMKIYIPESKKDWGKGERFDDKAGCIMNSSIERI
jgi:hypothetical protein